MLNKLDLKNFQFILLDLLPLAFVVGPLIVELIVNILNVIFVFNVLKNKNFGFLKNKLFIFLVLFYLILILSLFQSNYFNETKIKIELDLDGTGKSNIDTGLSFFDHMLDQLSKHSLVDLNIKVDGDLNVDEHHTVEDTAIALGESFLSVLGKKIGIERYAFNLPMDDCLAQVAIDFGGRSWLVWDAEFKREKIGDVPTEMFYHFFKSFTDGAKANLNIKAEGQNEHHKIEAIFKAFAKAIKVAVKRDSEKMILPSTKGML